MCMIQLLDYMMIHCKYLKVCSNVHTLQLGSFGVCNIEIPGTKHLVAKVDLALRAKLHIALVVRQTNPRVICV